ncbi:cold-shock protein [Paraburkholderia sp. SIMBA_054]|uniref:cold-shock protein n=1 Tax=Paraburkholderia sp. SIMBA_054 TaxID=3085795 RepID=UPI00397DC73F
MHHAGRRRDDLFAHFSGISAAGFKILQENQKVSFDVEMGPKGKHASKRLAFTSTTPDGPDIVRFEDADFSLDRVDICRLLSRRSRAGALC